RASAAGNMPLTASPPGAIFQDNIYGGNPFSFRSPVLSTHPNEHYDTFTGGLSLLFTDVDLPGPAGFGITVRSSYSLNQVYQSLPGDGTANGAVLQFGQFLGLGWQIHAGAVCGDPLAGADMVQVIDSEQSVKQAFLASPTFANYAMDDGS